MNRRNIIIFCVVILAIAASVIYVVTLTPAATNVYIYPQSTAESAGQNFTVDIRISGASDLFGWELKMSWNITVLDVTNVTEGSFLQGGGQSTFPSFKINATAGYIVADCTRLGNVEGVNGSGTLATVELHVKTNGSCSLHLYDATLVNPAEQSTVPTLTDGQFSTP